MSSSGGDESSHGGKKTMERAWRRTHAILGDITYIKEEAWPYKKDQFSIIHKYTQTEIFWPRDVATLKPAALMTSFGDQSEQSVIYDAYEEDLKAKMLLQASSKTGKRGREMTSSPNLNMAADIAAEEGQEDSESEDTGDTHVGIRG